MKINEPNLIELATGIRDETMPERNTATRVGSLLILMVEKQAATDNALNSKVDMSVVNQLIGRYDAAIASLKSADKDQLEVIDGFVSTDVDFERRMKAVEIEVPKIGKLEGHVADLIEGCTMRFDGFASLGSVADMSVEQPLGIRFHTGQQVFVAEYARVSGVTTGLRAISTWTMRGMCVRISCLCLIRPFTAGTLGVTGWNWCRAVAVARCPTRAICADGWRYLKMNWRNCVNY